LGRARSEAALVDGRASALAAGGVIRNVDDVMVRLLAETSARTNDQAIKELLTRNDVLFRVHPPQPPQLAPKPSQGPQR
jgi:hypothetical protein